MYLLMALLLFTSKSGWFINKKNIFNHKEKILAYTSQLATEGCDLLVKELRLTPLSVPISMESPNLRLLKIPLVLTGQTDIDKKVSGM